MAGTVAAERPFRPVSQAPVHQFEMGDTRIPLRVMPPPTRRKGGWHGAQLMRSTPLAMLTPKPGLRVAPRRVAVGLSAEGLTAPLPVQPPKASGRGTPRKIDTPAARRTRNGGL